MQKRKTQNKSSSWEPVQKWYNEAVGAEGHYYHQHVVIPGLLKLLQLDPGSSLIDLGCGQGILARQIPQNIEYLGIDLSPSLIKSAKQYDRNPKHDYRVADITKPLAIEKKFTHAAVVLALQNVEHPEAVIKNAAKALLPGGTLVIIMNHPCFRIPRQSSWKVDNENKTQFRRLDRYMSPLKIPIHAHPGKGEQSESTWSFHFPLSAYSKWLQENGFAISLLEEWCSDKVSTGGAAKMENRARQEFPLFLAIKGVTTI